MDKVSFIIGTIENAAQAARARAARKKAYLESGGRQTKKDLLAAERYAEGLERAARIARQIRDGNYPLRL